MSENTTGTTKLFLREPECFLQYDKISKNLRKKIGERFAYPFVQLLPVYYYIGKMHEHISMWGEIRLSSETACYEKKYFSKMSLISIASN